MASIRTAPAVPANGRTGFGRATGYVVALALVVGAVLGVLVVEFNQPVYFLLGVATLAVCALAAFSVEFGLLVLIFMTYTRFSDIVIEYYNAPSVAKAYIAILVLAIAIRWVVFAERPKGWATPALLLGAYALVGFATILVSPSPTAVIDKTYSFVKDAAIALLIIILLQRIQAFQAVIWTLIVVGVFLGSLSVFQYFTGTFQSAYGGFAQAGLQQIVGTTDSYRIGGPIGDPNFFAQIMIVLVPIGLERAIHEKRLLLKIVGLWCFAVSLLCVILSYSRGGLLALVLCLGLWFLLNPPRHFQLPLLLVAGVLVIAYVVPAGYFERVLALQQFFRSQGTLRTTDPSLQGRISENLAAWNMFRTHPFLGVGWSSYRELFPFYSKEIGLANVASEREAHDLYLEVAAETGVLGLFTFGLILFTALRDILRARRRFLAAHMDDYAGLVSGFGAGFFGYLVAATFIHGAYPRYLLVLLGIAWSLPLVLKHAFPDRTDGEAAPVRTL